MHRRLTAAALMSLSIMAILAGRPGGASAQSIGFHPSTIDIENALRGQEYEISTKLINQSERPMRFVLGNAGETDGWVRFIDPDEPGVPLTEVTVQAATESPLTVLIAIPEDAANGRRTGVNSFDGAPTPGADSSAVALSFRQPVNIDVTGDQVLDLRATNVAATSVEAGQPLRIQIPLNNRGNVEVRPQFVARVFPESATSRANPIGEIDVDLDGLKPGSSRAATAEWSTSGQQAGSYWAEYALLVKGERVAQGEFSFDLLPAGTAVRAGAIVSLTVIEPIGAGMLGRADAVFENLGQAQSQVRFAGKLYKDGTPVADADSPDALLVPPGSRATLSAYFQLPEDASGTYELRGHAVFDGAQTAEATAAFHLGGESSFQSMLTTGGIVVAVLGMVALAVAGVLQRRRDT